MVNDLNSECEQIRLRKNQEGKVDIYVCPLRNYQNLNQNSTTFLRFERRLSLQLVDNSAKIVAANLLVLYISMGGQCGGGNSTGGGGNSGGGLQLLRTALHTMGISLRNKLS